MIPLTVLGVAVVMIFAELTLRGGRRWPKVAGWWTRALLLNAVQVGAAYLTAYLLDS